MARILEIYDIEVLANCFTYTSYVPDEDKYYQFVIWKKRNEYNEFCEHITRGIYQVGFNNEDYDYPVLHHLLNHYEAYKYLPSNELVMHIYDKSQELIDMEFSAIADKNKFIPQLDLYRIWHFNNPARACSLKHLEVAMKMDNVEDMPFDHTHYVQNEEELQLILDYNKHDVKATYEFFKITKGETDHPLYAKKDKLLLRKQIMSAHQIPCLNYPDVKLGEQLLLKLYCEYTKKNVFDVKKLKSPRSEIKLADCIFDYIKFETPAFKALHEWLLQQTITSTKGAFTKIPLSRVELLLDHVDKSLIGKDGKTGEKFLLNLNIMTPFGPIIYGTGGLHHSQSGVYRADLQHVILDIDVGSLYPSIAVQNNLYPEHLGPSFSKIYDENIVSVRLTEKAKPKKERNPVIMEGFKLAANGRKLI